MIFTLTITCVGGAYLKETCVRVIEIDEEASLYDLHEAIQDAVNFDRDHLYEFFLAHTPYGMRQRFTVEEDWKDRESKFFEMRLCDVFPTRRKRLHYLFEFGDRWIFEIRKARGSKPAAAGIAYPRVVDAVGPNPVYLMDSNWKKRIQDHYRMVREELQRR